MLFKKNHLNEVLETTSASMDVFVPAIVDGTSRFALYGEQGEVTEPNFQLQNTKIPPKGLLFPSTEKLYTWGKGPDGTFIDPAPSLSMAFVHAMQPPSNEWTKFFYRRSILTNFTKQSETL